MSARLEVADIFRAYGPAYRQRHPLSDQQRRVMHAIEVCRTSALGGHLWVCDECHGEVPLYNSCGNRHCPKCQSLEKEKWIEARANDLLPVEYFHPVFTVPDTLHPLFRANQKTLYDMLFRASRESLVEIAADPKHLGAKIGGIGVLHTWGSDMSLHPHTHFIVPGGGLSSTEDRWIACPPKFLLPVEVLSEVFRGKFIDFLQRAYRTSQLQLHGALQEFRHPIRFEGLIDQLYAKNWVVYCKPPFAGPEKVLQYLARYTHRVAISNERLIEVDDHHVVFRFKDYAQGGTWETRRLAAEEFIRRFLQHVLPLRFVRIRYFGLLGNRSRKENLERARTLLEAEPPKPSAPEGETRQEMLERLTGADPRLCPKCGHGRLKHCREFPRPGSPMPSQRAPP
ncbi:MAG: IS91 family transposase [bacterium]|nr:IS91 family transposase [bacterium]